MACLLTYIAPAGLYEMDGNNRAISRTFQYVENTPINPWRAMLMVKAGAQSASFSAVVYKLNINEASKTFLSGAQSMGGIALIMVCARLRHVAGAQWGNK